MTKKNINNSKKTQKKKKNRWKILTLMTCLILALNYKKKLQKWKTKKNEKTR
jgi:type II secretory pathway component PulL